MRAAMLLLAVLWSAGAWAADVKVIAVDGALRPGGASEVWVGLGAEGGDRLEVRPTLVPSGGVAVALDAPTPPGVWAWAVTAPPDADELALDVRWGGGHQAVVLPVTELPPSSLRVDAPVVDTVAQRVWVTVTGEDLPEPTALQVVTSEGQVGAVEALGDRLRVAIELDDDPFPRLVMVGIRDARRASLPVWGLVRVRARFELPLEGTPDAEVIVDVGGRRYGPVRTDGGGHGGIFIEQYPGERTARLVANPGTPSEELRLVPLSGQEVPRLTAFVTGPRYPGEVPPDVLLRGLRPDGRAWTREPPSCRAPGLGDLTASRIEPGTWRLALPARAPSDVWEVRIRCDLGGGEAVTTVSVPLAEGVPVALTARVWADVISADLPVADVKIALENAVGERIESRGRFEVSADLGSVQLDGRAGPSVRAVYRGEVAAEGGEDKVHVRWFAPPGSGYVDRLEVATGPRQGDRYVVYARALDRQRRPLRDVSLDVSTAGTSVTATTADDGWATLLLPWRGEAPTSLTLAAGAVDAQVVVMPGVDGPRGAGRPDLARTLDVQIDPGRVAEIELVVSPRLVRPGPRARALVRARLLDRAGLVASSSIPGIEASAGTLTPHEQAEDGAWEWTWVPPPGYRERTIDIIARDAVLGVEERTSVTLRPPPITRWVSGSVGLQTNFGRIVAPFAAVDAAWWIRVGPRGAEGPASRSRMMLRAGVGWYGAEGATNAPGNVEGRVRMDLVPISVLLALRQEYPAQAFWFGLGGVLAPYVGSAAYDGVIVTRRIDVLPPGLVAVAGYGLRVPGGEVAIELKGTVLTSPGNDISFRGQVGGLAATLAYRVAY